MFKSTCCLKLSIRDRNVWDANKRIFIIFISELNPHKVVFITLVKFNTTLDIQVDRCVNCCFNL